MYGSREECFLRFKTFSPFDGIGVALEPYLGAINFAILMEGFINKHLISSKYVEVEYIFENTALLACLAPPKRPHG